EDEVSSSGHAQLRINELWPGQHANRCLLNLQSISCTVLFSLYGACCWPRFPSIWCR
ncbi:hypothetical protein ATANTOWER_024709, partial [Ataeniobius toweri]|nr:hypothetical protein [Ataeniobius toweri]